MAEDPRANIVLRHWRGGERAVNLHIWHDGELYRYRLDRLYKIVGNNVFNEVKGFSDNFDELLSEALAEARQHAEVLRRG